MIRSYIDSKRNRGMILKLERFFHQSDQPFGLDFPIGFGVPIISAFIESRCLIGNGYLEEGCLVLEKGFRVKVIQSVSYPWTSSFSRGGQ